MVETVKVLQFPDPEHEGLVSSQHDQHPMPTDVYARHFKAAREFHAKNPEVWKLFVRLTRQLIKRGFTQYSAKAIFHVIRWHLDVPNSKGRSSTRINHEFSPCYANMFMQKYPEHEGFFRSIKPTKPSSHATWSQLEDLGDTKEDYQGIGLDEDED